MAYRTKRNVSACDTRALAAVRTVILSVIPFVLCGPPTATAQVLRSLPPRPVALRSHVIDVSHQDGIDDTEALQRAIDLAAATGGSVHIRSGVYHLKIRDGIRALAPRHNVRVTGDGPAQTVLRLDAGQAPYEGIFYPEPDRAQDVSGFSLANLAIDQNTTRNPIGDATSLSNKPRFILAVFSGSDIQVDHCRFTDIAGTNTLVFNGPRVSNIRIADNEFEKVGNVVGVHYDHSTIYTHADRVYIAGNAFAGRVNGGGAFGATTAIETHGNQQIVSKNVITGYFQGMNTTGVAESSERIIVADNVISDVTIGIQLWSYYYGSNKAHPGLADVSIRGNAITISRDPWIRVVGSASFLAAGILLNPNSDAPIEQLRIEGNTICFNASEASTNTDAQSGGIEMWLTHPGVVSRNIAITHNQISGSYGAGIRLSMSAETVTIANNIILNPGRSTTAVPDRFRSGVLISYLQNRLAVTGNQLVDDQERGTMTFGIYNATSAASHQLQAVDNQVRSRTNGVPVLENEAGSGMFCLVPHRGSFSAGACGYVDESRQRH